MDPDCDAGHNRHDRRHRHREPADPAAAEEDRDGDRKPGTVAWIARGETTRHCVGATNRCTGVGGCTANGRGRSVTPAIRVGRRGERGRALEQSRDDAVAGVCARPTCPARGRGRRADPDEHVLKSVELRKEERRTVASRAKSCSTASPLTPWKEAEVDNEEAYAARGSGLHDRDDPDRRRRSSPGARTAPSIAAAIASAPPASRSTTQSPATISRPSSRIRAIALEGRASGGHGVLDHEASGCRLRPAPRPRRCMPWCLALLADEEADQAGRRPGPRSPRRRAGSPPSPGRRRPPPRAVSGGAAISSPAARNPAGRSSARRAST